MQLHELVHKTCELYPEKYVIWDHNIWYTYAQLETRIKKVASYLMEIGIKRGDRVSLLMDNSFTYVVSYFAILEVGAVVVGLNTETTEDALSYLLNDSDSVCLFISSHYRKYLHSYLVVNKSLNNIIFTDDLRDDPFEEYALKSISIDSIYNRSFSYTPIRSIDIDLAEIVYTSGSTGKPKGVMLTHLNLVSNMLSICNYLELTNRDRMMVILPFYYIYGKSLLLTHIMVGASLVIDNRFTYPNKVLENMVERDVTGFAGVPSTFLLLLNKSSLKSSNFPSLRYVTQAGGAMAPTIQKEVVDAFSPAELFIMYGTTEAAPRLSYLRPDKIFQKWGSIGIPVDNVDLIICDKNGKELPQGEVGEIVARGSNIMKGYWKDLEETQKVLKDGLYFTGDLGRVDKDGYFFIAGRSKDMIKTKGIRISAKEIEEAIQEMNEVLEVAVLGVDDPIQGEAILALIVPKDEKWNNTNSIRLFLKNHLPSSKIPKYIELRKSLPKNKSGKIQKRDLKLEENKRRRN